MSKFRGFLGKPGVSSLLASLFSIICGLIFGFILLFVFNAPHAVHGMKTLLTTGFLSAEKFAKVLYQSAPLVMTGLAVGFAFKTGLFNIGASGQYLIGAMCALIAGIIFQAPWWVCLFFAMAGGAVWGLFPGLFKALFNVNEVITSIMFNWIGLFLVNLVVSNIPRLLVGYYGGAVNNRTVALKTVAEQAIIPRMGLDEIFGGFINIGFFIAIIFAIVIYVILDKTTFGYELKACGLGRSASVYAGISDRKSIILSMVIAGGLAGVAGGLYYLSGPAQYVVEKLLPAMGFNGIPVALLASSNPIGTIFSALFISFIQVGGDAMQPEFAPETIDIIIAVIIYLSAFSLLMKNLISRYLGGRKAVMAEGASGIPEAETELSGNDNQDTGKVPEKPDRGEEKDK